MNLTRAQLAERAGVTPANLAHIERHALTTRWDTLIKILKPLYLEYDVYDPDVGFHPTRRSSRGLPPQITMEEVGKLIRTARRRQGYTQKQFAKAATLNRLTLIRIERGNPNCSWKGVLSCLLVLNLQQRLILDEERSRQYTIDIKRDPLYLRKYRKHSAGAAP